MHIRYRVLVACLALIALGALMIALPALSIALVLTTFGFAGFIPTIALYATLALPILVLRSNGPLSITLKGASVALIVYVGFLIPRLNTDQIDSALVQLTKDDFRRPVDSVPRHVKFLVTARWTDRAEYKEPILKTSECHRLCQRLLLNNAVETVTIEALDNGKRVSIATYHMEKRARCPDAFYLYDRAITDMVLQAMEGNCLIAQPNEDMESGLQLENNLHVKLPDNVFLKGYPSPTASRLLVSEKSGNEISPKLRQTSVKYRRPSGFLSVGVYGGLLTTVSGVSVTGTNTTHKENSETQILETEYGLAASPPKDPVGKPTKDTTSLMRPFDYRNDLAVIRVLDDTNAEPFNNDISFAMYIWMSSNITANYGKPLAPHKMELINRVFADARVKMNVNLPWILNKLSDPKSESKNIVLKRLCNTSIQNGSKELEMHVYSLAQGNLLPKVNQKAEKTKRVEEFKEHYCRN